MIDFSMIHTADLGLRDLPYGGINPKTGLNTRFEDVVKNFRFVMSNAIRRGCKYFVIAGDINEERNPESILIEYFSGFVADLISKDIKVIIVAGNHDVDGSQGKSTSVSYIKTLGLVNTFIADRSPEKFEFDDVVFHCIPTMYPSTLFIDKAVKDNKGLSEYLDNYIDNIKIIDGKTNVLVTHYSLESTFEGLDVDEPVLKEDILSKFDYVALGHIHKYEMSKKFVGGYCGSLFVKDFGEQFDKYFNVVEFKGNPEVEQIGVNIDAVRIPERRFVQFEIDGQGLSSEELLNMVKVNIKDVKDAVIKLKVKADRRVNPKLVYGYLREQKVFHYAPIQWDIERPETHTSLDVKSGHSDNDIIDTFLGKQEIDGSFKESVKNYTDGIVKTWEEDCY